MQTEELRAHASDLRARARAAYRRGDLTVAEGLYEDARLVARELDDAALEDLCACSKAGLAVEQERGEAEVAFLRGLMLRSTAPFTSFLAAYWIARHYELKKDSERALFYGRAALHRAKAVDEGEPLAGALIMVGNALLARGSFAEAGTHFEEALATRDAGVAAAALARVNLGYCQVLTAEPVRGLGNLLQSARVLKRLGADRYLAQAHLDASYGYLEIGRAARALRHGERALALSQSVGWATGQKNALYLLGQSALLGENFALARAHFALLQTSFYPHQPYLPDFLMTVDIREMVNLHA
jgi:tetratricopeptide (TPR) repeat protein